MTASNMARAGALAAATLLFTVGCSTTQRNTQSARTAVEQLLLSEAVKRSLPRESRSVLPVPHGANVAISTVGMTPDQAVLQQVVAGWLGQQG